ncbi:uncharacterized protein RSE6_03711 [Rhynchosporium secalis]|uniref:Uncharacterized protein n=1 Tax=Rhynchosporium secalis TaxID=38038 RepID=A0A1E1M4Y2_RHYSE|nr:uncharacterized protein RSE6_03711 [Rhynchosporium secalis]
MRLSPEDDDDEDEGQYPNNHQNIVKGDYRWQQQHKAISMSSPGMDILAKINTPRNLESPEPFEENISATNYAHLNSQPLHTPQPTPKQRSRLVAPTMEDRLQQMPKLRELPWRDGVEDGADNETGGESRRKQIRFGCLLATRGEIQQVPCQSCANGRGKFNVCVALDGYFKGACASCQLSGRPNRCSIKKNEAGEIAGSPSLNPPLTGDHSPLRNNDHQPPHIESPQHKRRKIENSVPEWESARPQWEQELGESARQQMNQIVERPWASVNPTATMSVTHPMMNRMNGAAPLPQGGSNGHRNSLGWASVNQPMPMAGQPYGNGVDGNVPGYRINTEQDRREETMPNEDGSAALIDALPKNKQRQVYGLVSGLQGGIEHLQRELNSLKKALGINDED